MAAPRRLGVLGSRLPWKLALDDFIGLLVAAADADAAEAWQAQRRRFFVLCGTKVNEGPAGSEAFGTNGRTANSGGTHTTN